MMMRWRGRPHLLLIITLAIFFLVAVAEDTVPAENKGDSTSTQPGVGKVEQPDDTKQKTEVVHEDGGLKNNADTAGNDKKDDNNDKKNDNTTEGTSGTKDEPVQQQQPNNKGSQATKPSETKGFMQDPLIMECDPSHRCIIEKDKFIACLKVPGEDSLDLSLLMDNKGANPLNVSIKAPEYVTLAEKTVHIEANSHSEVSVTVVGDAGNNTAIVLVVAEGNCTINIHSAIAREAVPVMRMRLTSTNMLVPLFILLAVVGVCVKLRTRGRQVEGLVAYQKLDTTELPVSVGGKKEPAQSDKWDDNWGDDWDDEEAPLTPSKPMPNPSSAGLAARRSTKDGWKD